MWTLGIDIETYCEADLTEIGVYKYVEDATFEVLLFAYSVDNAPVRIVDFAQGENLPVDILNALTDSTVLKTAYNATFERVCLSKWLGKTLPVEQWECSMVKAAICGLPLGLGFVGKILGFQNGKMDAGKALIPFFCKPCKPTQNNNRRTRNLPKHDPDKWELFKSYCIRDVEVEQNIRHTLAAYPYSVFDKQLYCIDQTINDRGVLLDRKMINIVLALSNARNAALEAEATQLTGIGNVNSIAQSRSWLQMNTPFTVDIDNLSKSSVQELMKQDINPAVRRFLEIRQELSKTSIAKYDTMIDCMSVADDRARGLLQFYGSRTGRWAGRMIQVQNLPQNHIEDLDLARESVMRRDIELLEIMYGNVADVFSQLIRTAFVAQAGSRFIVADFSAIEARVIAWLAGEGWRLDVFRSHGKIYEASASAMFHIPIEQITKGSEYRKKGKVAELACGYEGGLGAMKRMGADKLGLSDEEITADVKAWRKASPHIVTFWKLCLNAFVECIVTGKKQLINKYLTVERDDTLLWVNLPSGRRMCYYKPEYDTISKKLTYWGLDSITHQWKQQTLYGGKITENIVQAVARDCLGEFFLKLTDKGYRCVFHVHDEVVLEMPYGQGSLDEVLNLMRQSPDWAVTLPLKGDGFETTYYKKD